MTLEKFLHFIHEIFLPTVTNYLFAERVEKTCNITSWFVRSLALMLTLWIKVESCRKSREVHDLPFPGDETIIPQQNLSDAIKTNCWAASHPSSHWGQLRRRTVRFYSKNSSEALENPHAIRSHSQNSLYSLKSSINAFNGKWWMTHLQNPNACEFLKVAEFLIWLASLIIWYT